MIIRADRTHEDRTKVCEGSGETLTAPVVGPTDPNQDCGQRRNPRQREDRHVTTQQPMAGLASRDPRAADVVAVAGERDGPIRTEDTISSSIANLATRTMRRPNRQSIRRSQSWSPSQSLTSPASPSRRQSTYPTCRSRFRAPDRHRSHR